MEILPFETTWTKLGDIKLSEINQRKSNTVWYHLYVKSKKKENQTQKQRAESWLPEAGELEKWRDSEKSVQTSSYKVNKV